MSIHIRSKKLTNGYESAFLDIHLNGRRWKEFPGVKYKANPKTIQERTEKKNMLNLVQIIANKREMEILRTKHGILEEYDTNTDFISYAKQFILHHQVKDKRKLYLVIEKLQAFAGKKVIPCYEITENFLNRYVQKLHTQLNGESCSNYFKKLKQILKAATADLHFRVNPAINIKVKQSKFLHKAVLSIAEIQTLANTPLKNDEVRRAFIFCCVTGLRFCDVSILKWGSISSEILSLVQQKTKVPITIPLNQDALDLLPARRNSEDLIFNLPSQTASQKWLKVWAKAAGIEKVLTWHSGRHSYGTNLITYGVDVSIASKLLGHTSLLHTQRYVRINDELKAQAVAKLPIINRNKM